MERGWRGVGGTKEKMLISSRLQMGMQMGDVKEDARGVREGEMGARGGCEGVTGVAVSWPTWSWSVSK